MYRTALRAARTVAGLSVLLAAACADSSGPGATSPVSLSFRTGAAAFAAGLAVAPAAGASSDVRIELGADVIDLTRAAVVVRKIELASTSATACDDDSDLDTDGVDTDASDSDTDDGVRSGCTEIELGARLVALPVGGASSTTLDLSLPQGSYRFVEAKIRPARADDRDDAALLAANPDLAGVSVVVEGRFNGRPFTYRGRVEAEIERAFDPPLVLDAAGTNVGVSVDLANWFRGADGRLVDPATANRGGVNEELVARNIKRSFHAFEDEDHDGRDDSDDDSDDSGPGGDDN